MHGSIPASAGKPAGGKPVFTLESPDNAHLVALGAEPVSANDPAPLLAGGNGSSA